MPPQEPQLTDEDREAAKLLRRMLQAQAKLDAQQQAKDREPKTSFHERALQMGMQVVKPIASRNGYVYKDQSGKLFYADAGGSISNQEEIQRILGGETPKTSIGAGEYLASARRVIPPEIRTEAEKALVAKEPLLTQAVSAVQGIPFLGTFGDEAMGALTGSEGSTETIRAYQEAYQSQKPLEAFVGQMAMGAAATLPLIPFQAAGRALQAIPTVGRQVLTGLGIGAGAGAVEGAVSGFGAAEGTAEQRLRGAGIGAGVGGVVGGTLGALAAPVEMGVRNALQYFGNKPVRDLAKQFGISPDAAKVVLAAVQDNDIATAQAALQRAGSSSMLAEMTPSTKNLLDAAIALGSGGDRAQAALLTRNLRGEQEMRGAFNRFLGQPEDIVDVTGNIRQASSAARQQMYDAAYNRPIDYSTLAGRQLENWQRLIPAEALNYANKIRSMDPNARAPQILFKQNPDGTISFEELPNVEQWDLITRGLNEMAYGSPAGVMGGKSEVQSLAAKNAREIRKLVMDQVPEYRAALGLARDTIEEVKAAELGFDMLSGGVTVKEVRDMLSGQNPAAVQSMKLGLRSGLDHTLGNLKISAANPNTEIKELMAGLSALRSRNNMSKVRALLGDADADEFYKVLDEQATGIELASAVATNSKTAQRQAVGRTVEEIAAPGILGTMLRGEPVNASRMIVQSVTGKTPEADAARRMGLYDDIATLLTRVQGQSAKDALNLIQQAKSGKALSDVQARIVAKAVTAPAAIGAYKAITAGESSKRTKPFQAGMGRPE
jgi:hypothetical protein